MYSRPRKSGRPGRGCLIAFIIVVVVFLVLILFVRFALPRIAAKLILDGKNIEFIPNSIGGDISTDKAEFSEALGEYNMTYDTLGEFIDSVNRKKLVSISRKIQDGTLKNSDAVIDDIFNEFDFGTADIVRLKKEISKSVKYNEFQDFSEDILDYRKLLFIIVPFVKDTLKAFVDEMSDIDEFDDPENQS